MDFVMAVTGRLEYAKATEHNLARYEIGSLVLAPLAARQASQVIESPHRLTAHIGGMLLVIEASH